MSILNIHSSTEDVEEVMQAIQDQLQQWQDPSRSIAAPTPPNHLARQAHQLRFQWHIDGQAIIHSTRPRIGPWIIRFQTLVRRLTGWFLDPILLQIRLFQMNTARVVDQLAQNQERLQAQAGRVDDLSRQVEQLAAQVEELQIKLAEQDGQNGDPA